MQRECGECKHIEMAHFEKRCYRKVGFTKFCDCVGFTARELDEAERKIAKELQEERRKKVDYLGEAWMDDLMREWSQRRIPGLDD